MQQTQQARTPQTQPFGEEAFGPSDGTTLRRLGMAGFLINSRSTTIMIDPLLEGFDMPIMIDMPIAATDVPELDAILVTHSDNDHYSVPTCRALASVTRAYHSTGYVASLMQDERWPAHGHAIGDALDIGPAHVELTPTDHAWQNESPGASDRVFQPEDACGFWIETPDSTVWAPGDSRLIPDHHLQMPAPDALLFDFSDSEWHFGLEGAARMATPTRRRRSCSTIGGVSTPPTSPRSTATQPRYPAWSRILSASSSSPQANPMNSTA
jgi:L-ascorbate metabolism protein UlaG (beta-lactamase superfamily)